MDHTFYPPTDEPEGRWRVTLNIGLLNNTVEVRRGQDYLAQWIAQRFAQRVNGVEDTLVQVAYYDDYVRAGEHTWVGLHHSDKVTEPTAVVEFDVEPFDMATFEKHLVTLANEMAQGAVAYTARPLQGPRYKATEGLVGLQIQRWGGTFDGRYFQPLDALRYGAHLIETER